MKVMTCAQLGGPSTCTEEFRAETFEEIGELSKNHGMEMFQKGDERHLAAMNEMKKMGPEGFQEWFEAKRKEFEELPDVS